MEEFELKGLDAFLAIRIDEVFGFPNKTSHFGGYDCVAVIEIKVGGYNVKGKLYSSTGELFEFYQKLNTCQTELNGLAELNTYEGNLELSVKYTFGKVSISGRYQESFYLDNIMDFEFNSDQSYLKETLEQLNRIVDKYGGMRGIDDK